MKSPGGQTVRKYLAFLSGIALALVALFGVLYLYYFAPRIVVRATAPNGVKFYVIQRKEEPFSFNTSVHYRKPDGSWGGYYYDHEDEGWRSGRVALDHESKLATVFRKSKPVIYFNWETESCSVLNGVFRKSGNLGGPSGLAFWNPFSR